MNEQIGSPTLEEEAGLRAAYAAHGDELYRMARRTLGDRGQAEEAVQETFLRAWRAADRYDPEISSLRTWLFAIARNVVIDLARARSARPELAATGEKHEKERAQAASDEQIEEVLQSWEVEEALRRISDEHRRTIFEVYYRDRPYAEIAAKHGVPEGTVRSRLFYGLKALRLALEEMGWTR